ncbi:hypothetical protein SAMN05216552_103737 [Pseudoduganella namucuonensis]|uniref:Uncharacterized protein n=1 Tax=Pseudoduganella namucuonensis TaxID=1035707 RepID=A0A1I7LTC5_9BURK|nr:hypothetical protein SAMN05216552_103737 [Pseudoduganella namucuonensis]
MDARFQPPGKEAVRAWLRRQVGAARLPDAAQIRRELGWERAPAQQARQMPGTKPT